MEVTVVSLYTYLFNMLHAIGGGGNGHFQLPTVAYPKILKQKHSQFEMGSGKTMG